MGNSVVPDAFQHVRDNMEELNGSAGAKETDLLFLRTLLDSPVVKSLVQEEGTCVGEHTVELRYKTTKHSNWGCRSTAWLPAAVGFQAKR
ncbi:MAGUK p55 sub member 6 [Homalodisca vitripennis]|nr:MAGUK p55 sub member 6 [Homalodisca vitripennis]